ncbi:uncharacterized protein [Henckelia pumila]|uniref:uncharacterized protein n=1 Tax=Henckelia pumila TaxID=405737 RepID=UPI003C6E0E31
MKVVDFGIPGGRDLLRVKKVPKPTCGDHKIMIQVEAAGLSFYDTLDLDFVGFHCEYKPLSDLGFECSGKVVAVGSYVRDFKVGDEVCVILQGGGGCAEFITVYANHALRIPRKITLSEAAALPVASCLTFYALSMLTNIAPGKTILIHGDAGGMDIIAIQYAKYVLRCEVIAVAGMEEKLLLYKMLGAEVCINYKEQDFYKSVRAETGERGVDIILDASGSAHFQKNLDCLAQGGSLVILGCNSGSRVKIDLSVLMHKDVKVIGGDLRYQFPTDLVSIFSKAAAKIWPLIESEHIKPKIGKTFSFAEATEAFIALEDCSIAGNILLVPP